MSLGLIGKKLGMTQIFDENGNAVAVTVVLAGPCQILEIKEKQKDGYSALKLGFEEKIKNVNNPEKGYFEALSKKIEKKITPKRYIKEFRTEATLDSYQVGQVLNSDFFTAGEEICVSGISKGKGFQGVVKRYKFHGGPASHGSKFHRKPGAIGAHTFPGRVWKGQRMPGHMGVERVFVKNLKIMKVDNENNVILIKGAIPGHRKAIVYLLKKQ